MLWLPAIEPTLRPTTYASYASVCRWHILPRLGQVKLQRLDGATLNALYAHLLKAGGVRREGGLAPRSVQLVHRTLHRALRDAVRWGYLSHNVADNADPPRQTGVERELPIWSEEQLHAFLESVREERLYPLWRFLSMTGCRRGEALGLQWRDLDMEAGTGRDPPGAPADRQRGASLGAQDQARPAADRPRCRDTRRPA